MYIGTAWARHCLSSEDNPATVSNGTGSAQSIRNDMRLYYDDSIDNNMLGDTISDRVKYISVLDIPIVVDLQSYRRI